MSQQCGGYTGQGHKVEVVLLANKHITAATWRHSPASGARHWHSASRCNVRLQKNGNEESTVDAHAPHSSPSPPCCRCTTWRRKSRLPGEALPGARGLDSWREYPCTSLSRRAGESRTGQTCEPAQLTAVYRGSCSEYSVL